MLCRTNNCATKEKQTMQQQLNTSTDISGLSGCRKQDPGARGVLEAMKGVKKSSAILSDGSIRAADPNW